MNPRSIVIVMITIDRSPKANYLGETLDNLRRAGTFSSELLHSFHLCNSTGDRSHLPIMLPHRIHYRMAVHRDYIACENAGRALKIGAESGAPWVLFCEDDIDVCANFLESVSGWLDRFGDDRNFLRRAYGIFPFAFPYPINNFNSQQTAECAWESFYGTQCFAVRSRHASALGDYLLSNPLVKNGREPTPTFYDLMIADWLRANNLLILCSSPSFVEHIGRESVCTDRAITHRSPSWPGREWSYAGVDEI